MKIEAIAEFSFSDHDFPHLYVGYSRSLSVRFFPDGSSFIVKFGLYSYDKERSDKRQWWLDRFNVGYIGKSDAFPDGRLVRLSGPLAGVTDWVRFDFVTRDPVKGSVADLAESERLLRNCSLFQSLPKGMHFSLADEMMDCASKDSSVFVDFDHGFNWNGLTELKIVSAKLRYNDLSAFDGCSSRHSVEQLVRAAGWRAIRVGMEIAAGREPKHRAWEEKASVPTMIPDQIP